MATYYVTSAGTNAPPYTSEITGATSFATLNNSGLLVNGDTVRVCSDMFESVGWNSNITVMSNDTTKYKINMISFGGTSGDAVVVDGLSFTQFFSPPSDVTSVIIRNCEFATTGPAFAPPIFGPSVIIENNIFHVGYNDFNNFMSIYDSASYSGDLHYAEHIRINNNVFVHTANSFEAISDCSLIAIYTGDVRHCQDIKIYNNIYYASEPNAYTYMLNLTGGSASLPITNLVLENNNTHNIHGLIGGAFPEDAGAISPTNTIVNPVLADDYYLSNSSPLIRTGYNHIQIGIGMISFLGRILTPATTVNKIGYYYPNFGQSPTVVQDY